LAIGSAAAVALGIAFLVEWRETKRESAFAEIAAHAAPEVAVLLHDANQVAVDVGQQFPHSPDALNVMAQLHDRFGQAKTAVEWWEKCLELDPDFSTAYYFMGTVALEKGDHAIAEMHFRDAIRSEPSSSLFPVHLAEVLMHQGKLDEAAEVLRGNVEAHPGSMPSYALLGQAYVQTKAYGKARECLELAVKMGPDYTNAYWGLQTACTRLGDHQQAKEYLERFKALKAKDEQSHRTGIKTADDVAEVRLALAEIYTLASRIYIAHGDVSTGEAYLRKAIELAPNDASSREVLIWLYARQGRKDDALKGLEELCKQATDDVGLLVRLGTLCLRLQQYDRAEQAYERAVELRPYQTGGLTALVDLYLQTGRKPVNAKTLALRATAMEPIGRHYFLLALACQRNGDLAGAFSAVDQAVELEPNNADYQQFREMMRTAGPKEPR